VRAAQACDSELDRSPALAARALPNGNDKAAAAMIEDDDRRAAPAGGGTRRVRARVLAPCQEGDRHQPGSAKACLVRCVLAWLGRWVWYAYMLIDE
jgi:hypothetical protein